MTELFMQTDGNSVQTALCSGDSEANTSQNCVMALNGTQGVSANTITLDALTLDPEWAWVISSATNTPYLETWDAGDWVVRVQISSTGDTDVTIEDIHICRISTAGVSLGTVTNRTGLGLTCAADTLREITFTNVGEVAANVTNRIGIVVSFANNVGSAGTVGIFPNTNITTPLDIASVGALNGTSA